VPISVLIAAVLVVTVMAACPSISTLMLHTHAVEKRVRVRPDVGARRLGQDEQYLTVREILSEASTLADGSLSRERSNFYRFGYATLGFVSHHSIGPDDCH